MERKTESERERKSRELIESYSTKELEVMLKESKELNTNLEKEFSKRKDRPLKYILEEELFNVIDRGMIIFILGIIVFGAIPVYFGVNDEFVNPTNSSFGLNNTFDLLRDVGVKIMDESLMQAGRDEPFLYFWIFIIAGIMTFIFPILKIFYIIYKRKRLKENENKTTKV